jgi:hypothetical protein
MTDWLPDETALERNTRHVSEAHDTYLEGAVGMEVQDDQEAREALAAETKTEVANDDLGTDLNSTTNAQGVPTYSGGNVVAVADNRAGVDEFPEDTQDVEDLEQEVLVRNALDAGELFATGGQIPPTNYEDATSVSPYVDGMWLAEASKQTGEKFF